MKKYTLRSVALLASLLVVFGVQAEHKSKDVQEKDKSIANGTTQTGKSERSAEELVQLYCTRCHMAPNPGDLTKEFWPMALYHMSPYVGMMDELYPAIAKREKKPRKPDSYYEFHVVRNSDNQFYAAQLFVDHFINVPMMSKEEWFRMNDYFVDNALPHEELIIRRPKPPILKSFKPEIPNLDIEPNGWVLATAVDEKRRRIFVGRGGIALKDGKLDMKPGKGAIGGGPKDVVVFDMDTGERLANTPIAAWPMGLEVTETGARISTHGYMSISRSKRGISQIIDWDLSGKEPQLRMLANGMERITSHHTLDMNGDGLEDIVVTGYGDAIFDTPGGLMSVLWQTPEYEALRQTTASAEIPREGPLRGAFRQTVMSTTAGFISSDIADFNNDGLPDIAALIAQGDQKVMVYINKGDETFEEYTVASLPPSSGGDSIQAADYNGDGLIDISAIYGDPPGHDAVIPGHVSVSRPLNGVRMFKNNGDTTFTQAYFYPMQGAVRGAAHDFDNDGDQDLAVIALNPEWTLKEPETFVYLENVGNWQFRSASLPSEYFGLWTSVDVADVNADQKPDIVLGLGNAPGYAPSDWTDRDDLAWEAWKAPSVMYLINTN